MSEDELQLASDEEARIEAILRSMDDSDLELETPPLDLWSSIDSAVRADRLADTASVTMLESPAAALDEAKLVDDNVVDLTSRFRRGPAFFAAAAAAVVFVVGAVVVSQSSTDDTTEVVGEAELVWTADDPAFVPEGADVTIATTIINDDGVESVRIDDGSLPTRADEDLELWLIGVDDGGELTIQTLGVIDEATGVYEVPADFDADAFESVLVDISFEPRDGDEAHSGASIVRGPIVEA